MLKFRAIYIFLFLIILMAGVLPIVNGAGCNAVFDMNTPYMHISGRCENGRVNITTNNKNLDEIYSASGMMLVIGEQYIIFLDDFQYLKKHDNENESIMNRYQYHRKIMSGRIVNNRYVLTYSPFPLMGEIKINGKLSLI